MEEFDLFSSVGGLEPGEEISNNPFGVSGGSNGEHPFVEHPSRTLSYIAMLKILNCKHFLSNMETYALCIQTASIVACNAMKALQNKPLRRRKLDLHFSLPKVQEHSPGV